MGIMIQGTASDVGKSIIATVCCRLLNEEGVKVAPFKAQNMTSETYLLNEQLEIALSQAIQAYAACTKPSVWMNPILFKLGSEDDANVRLLEKYVQCSQGTLQRTDYYKKSLVIVKQSIQQLSRTYDVIVYEGAGSPVELNLKDNDIVNMKVASVADVPVLLVADISRGGVFASIVGTLALLNKAEHRRVKGIIINKFRGDISSFQQGVQLIEAKTNIPVVGVIPDVDDHIVKAIENPPRERDSDRQEMRLYNDHIQKFTQIVKMHMDWEKVKLIMKRWNKS